MLPPTKQVASSFYRLKVESSILARITARKWPRSDEKGNHRQEPKKRKKCLSLWPFPLQEEVLVISSPHWELSPLFSLMLHCQLRFHYQLWASDLSWVGKGLLFSLSLKKTFFSNSIFWSLFLLSQLLPISQTTQIYALSCLHPRHRGKQTKILKNKEKTTHCKNTKLENIIYKQKTTFILDTCVFLEVISSFLCSVYGCGCILRANLQFMCNSHLWSPTLKGTHV